MKGYNHKFESNKKKINYNGKSNLHIIFSFKKNDCYRYYIIEENYRIKSQNFIKLPNLVISV